MSLCSRLSRLVTGSLLRGPKLKSTTCFTSLTKTFLIKIPHRQMNVLRGKPFVGKKYLADVHSSDGLPKSFTLIYRSNFQNYFLFGQGFVLLSIGAFVTVGISSYIDSKLSEEERNNSLKLKKAITIANEQREKVEHDLLLESVLKVPVPNQEDELPTPQLSDLVERDLGSFVLILSSLVIIAGLLFKILKVMPVRVYVGKKKHCVAVFYGSLLPGRTINHDFVAGTLKVHKTVGHHIFGNTLFKDGSGYDMVLLEQFFRNPADFHYLLGLYDDGNDYHAGDGDEMAQFKTSGEYGTKGYSPKETNKK